MDTTHNKADFLVTGTIYQVFIDNSVIMIGCDMHKKKPCVWGSVGSGKDGKAIKDAALCALVNAINPMLFQVHYYE